MMPLRLLSRRQQRQAAEQATPPARPAPASRQPRPKDLFEPADRTSLHGDDLQRYLQLERYGVILAKADRWPGHVLLRSALEQAQRAVDDRFAMVLEGFASLPQTINDAPGCPESDVETVAFLLARCTVTNGQFQKFVDSGAYDDLSLWPRDVWPHLIDFKDQTGEHAPRFWRNARHDRRLTEHPVVGICFYEAEAYAKWAGYRLPTEAEWQMAASWRIRSAAHVFRRYPWGDALDKQRCNIWASGVATTRPATDYPSGAAPNGVLQLVGNVWEWTSSDFEVMDEDGRPIVGDMLMKSIRGGAFDTYFPSQATSYFRTGQACLVRAYNTGFRCALDIDGNGP